MASLYLGTGQLEQELVRKVAFTQACACVSLCFHNTREFSSGQVRTIPLLARDARKYESDFSSRTPTAWFVQNENVLQTNYKE